MARIIRQRRAGVRLELVIESVGGIYALYSIPVRNRSREIIGHRTWIGPTLPIRDDPDQTAKAALAAVELIFQPDPR